MCNRFHNSSAKWHSIQTIMHYNVNIEWQEQMSWTIALLKLFSKLFPLVIIVQIPLLTYPTTQISIVPSTVSIVRTVIQLFSLIVQCYQSLSGYPTHWNFKSIAGVVKPFSRLYALITQGPHPTAQLFAYTILTDCNCHIHCQNSCSDSVLLLFCVSVCLLNCLAILPCSLELLLLPRALSIFFPCCQPMVKLHCSIVWILFQKPRIVNWIAGVIETVLQTIVCTCHSMFRFHCSIV